MSIATSAGLELVARYGAPERWLAVLVTLRPDGEPSTSVVTAGALPHPVTGEQVVAHTINEPASAGSYKALKAAGKERQPPWSGRAQRIGHRRPGRCHPRSLPLADAGTVSAGEGPAIAQNWHRRWEASGPRDLRD